MTAPSRDDCLTSTAWPFQEARQLLERFENASLKKGYVLFETGYGPSGLPHIGTFGEVARTSMVRHAFGQLSDIPTRLFAFSDDMDGLRKVPDNLPNPEMIRENLGKPLTAIPDPFETHESFGHHMNARLRAFLDQFGFDYEFKSATELYHNGSFDPTLRLMLEHYDAIMAIILPTLGDERQQTYSPFLPVCPRTGMVLQVPILERDTASGTILYQDPETEEKIETPVTGGRCKMQWKADWAMRWVALGVDYEMYGKDLTPSVVLSSKIARAIGGDAPEGFPYELFLDEQGKKISKSKGNGLTIDEWLRYAPQESLQLYMFQSPRKAKRLYFDVIPRAVDDYLTFLQKYPEQDTEKQLANPAYHIHHGSPPEAESPLSFSLLLNLASACNPENAEVLWGFISRYVPDASAETTPLLDHLAQFAVRYYHDFIKPQKQYRAPTEAEAKAMRDLAEALATQPDTASAEELQQLVYDTGNAHELNIKQWFKALYEVLLGASQGPRMGSFIALYGVRETEVLIDKALRQELAA